jgi:hypothetical protein
MKYMEKSTSFYVTGLVGKPLSLDKNSLRNLAYFRVKISCKDVTLVPNTRMGEIQNGYYEFTYIRELFEPNAPARIPVEINLGGQVRDLGSIDTPLGGEN